MWKKIAFGIIGALLLLIITGKYRRADAADYIVDSSRSELVTRLFKGGIASALAHDHVIRATEYSGKGTFDAENPSASLILLEVKTDSLKADEPSMREKYGLTKTVSEKDRAKIQATMESAKQMDVKKYPTMRFQSTEIRKQTEGQYIVAGNLTIHGVTQTVSFPATITRENESFRGKAQLRFKQSDFGIKPYTAVFGAVRNEDEAILYLDIIVQPVTIP
jgi:polyisoprenoid-binding protein YceI